MRIDVEIHLTATSFGTPEASAIPYALFHELVAHGFASEHARKHAGCFAEGWMDLVAFDIHVAALRAEPPFTATSRPFPIGKEAVRAGRRLHEARYVLGRDREASARYIALRAGEDLLEVLSDQLGSRERAVTAFWVLSAAFNRGGTNADLRDEACEAVSCLLCDESARRDLEEQLVTCARDLDDAEDMCARSATADGFFAWILTRAHELDEFEIPYDLEDPNTNL